MSADALKVAQLQEESARWRCRELSREWANVKARVDGLERELGVQRALLDNAIERRMKLEAEHPGWEVCLDQSVRECGHRTHKRCASGADEGLRLGQLAEESK